MNNVSIFTDGSCLGNGTSETFGGWAAILVCGNHEKVISGGCAKTTNNKMELLAVINGLSALKCPCNVDIYTDSAYVVGGLSGWIDGWKRKGWITANRKPVENRYLWECLDQMRYTHNITVHKVAGHSTNEYNNRADGLAVTAANEVKSSGAEEIVIA